MSIKTFVSSPIQNVFGTMSFPEELWNIFNTFDTMYQEKDNTNYPPFNLSKNSEDVYTIEIAVAGFKLDELDIVKEDSRLKITGNPRGESVHSSDAIFIRQKLSRRPFKLEFIIAKWVEIVSASLEDGILLIRLIKRTPEELKPQKIQIQVNSIPAVSLNQTSTPSLLLEEKEKEVERVL